MFALCSHGSMSRRIASRLEDVLGEGFIALACQRCGRMGAVTVSAMMDHCRQRRLRTEWRVVARLFRCSTCGQRPVRVNFHQGEAPPGCITPPSRGVPIGISPRAWHVADLYERKRLIRQARG
jgi:hypothetical protein